VALLALALLPSSWALSLGSYNPLPSADLSLPLLLFPLLSLSLPVSLSGGGRLRLDELLVRDGQKWSLNLATRGSTQQSNSQPSSVARPSPAPETGARVFGDTAQASGTSLAGSLVYHY